MPYIATLRRLLVVAAALLVGSGVLAQSGGPSGSITVMQHTDVTTLDPNADTLITTRNVVFNIFDALVERDEAMNLQPSLATSWTVVDDNTWRFTLREGVTFQDGTPFTADDVKFTVERIQDPANNSRMLSFVEAIAEVRIIDDHTIDIATKAPYPILLTRLAGVPIVSRTIIERMGVDQAANNPIGTGPFRFVEWVRDDHVTLEAYEDHWRGAPLIRTVTFRPAAEAFTRLVNLETGEADIVVNIPAVLAQRASETPGIRLGRVATVRVTHVQFDMDDPPFDDVRVRQALNYAVDVDAIIASILQGNAVRVNGLISPETFGYAHDVTPYTQDLERARALLAEAGYPDGFEVTFTASTGGFMQREVAEAIAGQLAEVGVTANVQMLEGNKIIQDVWDGINAPMYFFSWGSATFDADGTLFPKLRSGQLYSHFANERADALLDEAHTTLDQQRRAEVYAELTQLIKDEAPVIFLYQEIGLYGIRDGVQWEPRSDEMLWFGDTPPPTR